MASVECLEHDDILYMSGRTFSEFLNVAMALGVECRVHKFWGGRIELVFKGSQQELDKLWRWFKIRGHNPLIYAFDGEGELFVSVELKRNL